MTPSARSARIDPVTSRYERFADGMVAHGNATRAALDAGYKKSTAASQGSRLLKNAKVKALIAERQARLKAKFEIQAETVVEELVRIGMADVRDLITWDGSGARVKDSSEISEAAARAISSVKVRSVTTGTGKDAETKVEVELKLHPKAPALEALSKHLGLYKDPLERGLQGLADAIREARLRATERR